MRNTVLAVLLAAGAAMPMTATAQEGPPREDHPAQPGGDHRGGGHPGPGAQAPMERGAGPQGGRSFDGNRTGGGPPVAPGSGGYRPQPGQPGYRNPGGPMIAPGSGGYRPQPGQPGFRPGGPPVAPGSGGYRPQPGQPGYRNPGGPMIAPGSGGYRPQPGQPGFRPGGPPVAPGSGGYRPQPGQYGYHGYRPGPPPPGPGGGWNRGWRDNGRFDYRQYRDENNFIFRLGPYYAPPGWGYGYRRFSTGYALPAPLFQQGFWIDDPYYYRLPPAWGPYRWVRYYDDALLVDVRSGVVVDAVYGIFW